MTQAQLAYRNIEPLRVASNVRLQTAIESHPRLAARAAEEEQRFFRASFQVNGDPIAAMVQIVVDQLTPAAKDSEYPRAQEFNHVLFGTTTEEDVVAALSPYADGSALVLTSDAMLGSLVELAQVAAMVLVPDGTSTLHALKTAIRAIRPSQETIELITGLLRYFHLHQRTFGNSARLGLNLTEREADVSVHLFTSALRFILAHETSHFLLGHGTSQAIRLTSRNLPVCTDDQRCEFEADLVAVELSLSAEMSLAVKVFNPSFIAVMGAALALIAIESTEKAAFIRPGRSHPPAAVRLDRIYEFTKRWNLQVGALDAMLGGVSLGVARASDFDQPLPADGWNKLFLHPKVFADVHGDDYYAMMKHIDMFHCRLPNRTALDNFMYRQVPRGGCRDVSRGFALAVEGEIPNALRSLGVNPKSAGRIADRQLPLSFYSLQSAIWAAIGDEASNSTTRRTAAILLSKLMEARLM